MTVKEIFQTLEYGPAPEDAKLAQQWIQHNEGEFGHYIGGQWRAATTHFDSFNPANGQALARIGQGSQQDVNDAVKAARAALPAWQGLTSVERSKYLYALARQIQKHSRLFAVLETLDNGKPIRETRDIDIPLVARHFYHHAGWAQLRDSEFPGYHPVGVCGQIIPWNFPLLMLSWKIAPALAMGNTVILKPAEFTSLTALLFGEICGQVGLPDGVVNIVTGDGETGKAIVAHEGIDKIAFTGSTEVGRHLRRATAGTGKKLSLELGGKSPFIIFDDADLDAAVEGLVDAIWFNQGQVCCAGSRLLVQEGVAEKVVAKTKARMENLRVGDPLDKAVDVGAIVDKVQLERIAELVELGVEEGATKFQPKSFSCPKDGWYYPPTLLTDVEPASTVVQEEIFGPVLVAMTFRTPDEAIALANNTVYGLASSVWTENLNLAHDMASRIKAGVVWVNCTNQFDAAAGFGGYRESGFGREGGREGLYEYLSEDRAQAKQGLGTQSSPAPSPIDKTHKLYIGGKQVRPDGGYSLTIHGQEVSRGNRKDLRNAVEAADAALGSWSAMPGHGRAQILYYFAENLVSERERIGVSEAELDAAVERIMHYAAWADKFDGAVHQVPMRGLVYTRREPIGTCGAVCSDEPSLLGFLSLVLPLIAMGNTVVAIPSETNPLPVCELIRVIEASDFPGGVINIITGLRDELEKTLVEHDGVLAVWNFGPHGGMAEELSAANLKQTWIGHGEDYWKQPSSEWLRRATQVKNVWVPYGA
ncbi:MAG: aldehyde dehydrogenase family protein [Fimbriimonadaceae bacterium]|nr:aldehyde dehydrogenase family protein [Fimbriimonadaceae bacterium]